MQTNDYLDSLCQKFKKHFVIEMNTNIANNNIDMFAKCNLVLGRTLISKNDIIDRYESNEYVVLKTYNEASEKEILDFLQFTSKLPKELVVPHKEHKSSYINAVMVCNKVKNEGSALHFKKFKYSKIYKFYLQGFCEIRVILVNLKNTTVVTNKAGKQLKKVYLPTP